MTSSGVGGGGAVQKQASSGSGGGKSGGGKAAEASLKVPKPPKPPEKPLVPYLRYSRKVWETVKMDNQNLKLWEVGRIIGKMWRELGDAQKQQFAEDYEADKLQYADALKQYHNSPQYKAWLALKEQIERAEESASAQSPATQDPSAQSNCFAGPASEMQHHQPHNHLYNNHVPQLSVHHHGHLMQGPQQQLMPHEQHQMPYQAHHHRWRHHHHHQQHHGSSKEAYIQEDLDDLPDLQPGAGDDATLTAKHVAACRYQRNQLLMLRLLADWPQQQHQHQHQQLHHQQLARQAEALGRHCDALAGELHSLEVAHSAKRARLGVAVERGEAAWRASGERRPRVDFAAMAASAVAASGPGASAASQWDEDWGPALVPVAMWSSPVESGGAAPPPPPASSSAASAAFD